MLFNGEILLQTAQSEGRSQLLSESVTGSDLIQFFPLIKRVKSIVVYNLWVEQNDSVNCKNIL
jgi:hypothetical protein